MFIDMYVCRYFVQEDVMEINQLTMQKSGWRVEEILRNYFFFRHSGNPRNMSKKNNGNLFSPQFMINGFAVFVYIVFMYLYIHLDLKDFKKNHFNNCRKFKPTQYLWITP